MKRFFWPLLALTLFAGCSDSNSDLNDKLMDAVTEGELNADGYKTIDMAELTDFDWDKMYYFQPNEDQKAISDAIGFRWEGSGVQVGSRRLLFVKGEEVVSFVDYVYEELPLFVYGCQDDQWVYPQSRSEFASFTYCVGEKDVHAFIPVRCLDNIKDLMEQQCPEAKEKAE